MGRYWGRGNAGDESDGGGKRVAGDKDGWDGYPIVVKLQKTHAGLSFGLVPLLLAPLDHGNILHRGLNNVIASTGTVGVAESLGVPGQTHWHGRINLGHGKGANGASSNLLAQHGGLYRGERWTCRYQRERC